MHDRGGQRDITTGVAEAEAKAEAVTARKQREATTGEERTVDVL